MALDLKKNNKDTKNKIQQERRIFLKKTMYAAPSIIALGQLIRPTNARADGSDAVSNDSRLGAPKNFWN